MYPASFVIICSKSEIDEGLRKYSNVLIAKDYYTNIEQDLALVNVSAIHMGPSSGPGTMALFSRKPFCMVNTDMINKSYKGFVKNGNRSRFLFSNPVQSYLSGQETPEILVDEFKRMWSTVDLDYWKHKQGRHHS